MAQFRVVLSTEVFIEADDEEEAGDIARDLVVYADEVESVLRIS